MRLLPLHASVTLALFFGWAGLPATAATAPRCAERLTHCSTPAVASNRYVYDWDGSTLGRSTRSSFSSIDRATKRVYAHTYLPACGNAGTPDSVNTDTSCSNAINNDACPDGQFAMWHFRRLVGPPRDVLTNPDDASWTKLPGVVCTEPQQTWNLADLAAIAREHLEKIAPKPHAELQPATHGIVQLPEIAHTDPAEPVALDVTQPFPGHLAATATYTWNFGDGAATSGTGRPYDGTNPLTDPSHYVTHTYTSSGTKTVTLTATWHATFSVAGYRIALDDITFTDEATVTIQEARSELVSRP